MPLLVLFNCDTIFDIVPPKIKIIEPKANTDYFGTMPVELDVTDNGKIAKVEVFLDGVSVHEFTKEPYEASLDISGRSAGTKTFKATAYDKAGNYSDAELQVRIVKETVSTPNAPSGSSSGNVNTSYSYSTSGANSNAGHSLEYRFDWGGSSYSNWSSSTSASHSWSSAETKNVKAQARCATHTSTVSNWSSSKAVTISSETVSKPTTPSGSSSGNVGTLYSYSTGGSSNSLGHNIQYRFDWGDGAYSTWSSSTSASHSWSSGGTYSVKTQARCTTHTGVLSNWSSVKSVTISGESITTPSTPSGPSSGNVGTSYSYSTGGASSSLGHNLQYRFYWEDGDTSSWSTSTSASHSWSSAGTYYVKAQARCATHTSVESSWSTFKTVTITSETVSTPNTPTGPSSGNVDISYSYSTGGASSNLGHSLQYRFYWESGDTSNWSSSTSASHSWSSAGTYSVKAQARCATHTSVISGWSDFMSVSITDLPFTTMIQKLLAPDAQAYDYFGISVALSGDYALVGANAEEAYIFRRTGLSSWDGGFKITATDAQAGNYFGSSVAISGDYALVGASGDDAGGSLAGAAYIFRRTGTNSWDGGTKLLAPDTQTYDLFGWSVAISGDYALVGAVEEDAGGSEAGAAYIFRRTGTNSWDGGAKLTAPDAQAGDMFGWSVAISGDYALVGAHRESARGEWAGAAYIFRRTGTTSWDSGIKLTAPDAQAYDRFGSSVAISGEYALVGAAQKDAGGSNAGAAYIFK